MRADQLIAGLDRALAEKRVDYYGRLRPGANDAALDAIERSFSLTLPLAFRALYRWRDGQDLMSFDELCENRMFLTLDDIRETKELLDGMIGSDFDDPRWWRRGWLPFMHNGGGSYLCIDIDAIDGGTPGQIREFWKADADRPVTHLNLEAWLADVVKTIEAG